jgi:hypothetical protein
MPRQKDDAGARPRRARRGALPVRARKPTSPAALPFGPASAQDDDLDMLHARFLGSVTTANERGHTR